MRPTTRAQASLLAAVLLVGIGVSACKTADDVPVTGEGAKAISESIDLQMISYLINNQAAGATLAVTRNGRLVWSKGYGYAHRANETPMEPWHRSRIGSVSKMLTTIGVLQLVEEGKLTLDGKLYGHPGDDISDPDWPSVDEPTVLNNPEQYWEAAYEGVADTFRYAQVGHWFRTLDWASQIELQHVLSHTAGYLRSGHLDQVEDYYGLDASELTYPDIHLAALKGVIYEPDDSVAVDCYRDSGFFPASAEDTWHQMPAFLFEPGTDRCYSNHGFGLLGHIIDERSAGSYRFTIEERVLRPLGLFGVVPNNTHLDQNLDAWPHGDALDGENPARFQATGGWSASAQDLARVMCSLDRGSNQLRMLEPETVTTMETVAFPDGAANQPLGWDSRHGKRLYKNGSTGGGMSVIMKFLPGYFAGAPQDEINVAVAVNSSGDGQEQPSVALLKDIAEKVASSDVPDDYDLFDPQYRCVEEGPTVTITNPNDGATLPVGTEINFEAEAHDHSGNPLPITWTMPGISGKTTQPSFGDTHSWFYGGLPAGTHPVTATTVDVGGHEATDELTVEITYDPPEVSIVSPADQAVATAGEALELVGQSTIGPFSFSLTDDQVAWAVTRDGAPVHAGSGHSLTVPASKVEPGSYLVTFTGNDGTTEVHESIRVTAEPKPESHPTATIIEPEPGTTVNARWTLQFRGSAVDGAGNPIDGTRFRWTATRDGEETLLCHGTNAQGEPPPGNGGIAAIQSCESFTTRLAGYHYGGLTQYTITLEVWDAEGNSDTATTWVRVDSPPAG